MGRFHLVPSTSAKPLTMTTDETPEPEDPDQRLRQLAIGTWEDDYEGKRTMTLRDDGTGTMVCELEGWNATFASRLQFEMTWSVKDGRLKKHTVSGKPAAKVRLILTALGDTVDEPIVELTDDRLLLLDEDGKTISFNGRFGEMWDIPPEIMELKDDSEMVECVLAQVKEPNRFKKRILYLYDHKYKKSRDEIGDNSSTFRFKSCFRQQKRSTCNDNNQD